MTCNGIALHFYLSGGNMAIEKRVCEVCQKEFYGSSNKKTCSGKCRTKKCRTRDAHATGIITAQQMGWGDESRIDVIGQNGNTGEHYDKLNK